MINRKDLERRFVLDVGASGTVHIRERGKGERIPGVLPVFSTVTRQGAELLRRRHCRLANNGSGLYILNDQPAADCTADEAVAFLLLHKAADLFRDTYNATLAVPGSAEP